MSAATPEQPPDLSVIAPQFARVPFDIIEPRHWCLWRREPREEGDVPTKIPYAVRGYRAKSSDPATWGYWAEVLEAYAADPERWQGVGIMLAPPLVGIDLDNSLDEAGRLLPWARDWFDPTLTYGEVSPSLKGVKFIGRGALPGTGKNLKGFGPDKTGGVEIYGERRFWTITGRRYDESPTTVNDCRLVAAGAYARLVLEREARKTSKRQAEGAERRARTGDVGNRFHRWTCYASKMDPSHSGENGHTAFFTAMCEAVRFDLSESGMWDAADWWNANKTDELWSEEEVRHKIKQAEQRAGPQRGERLTEDRPAGGSNGNGRRHEGNGKVYPPAPSFDEPAAEPAAEKSAREKPTPAGDMIDAYPHLRPRVIEKLLRVGEVMNLVAAPKMRKSYLVLDLALCLVTGRSWLGMFPPSAGRVLLVDNELHAETLAHRIAAVAAGRGILRSDYGSALHVHSLRGRLRDINQLGPFLHAIGKGEYQAIIFDAMYRAMPPDAEKDPGVMTGFYNSLDAHAERLGCAIIGIHHTSKGVQGGKSITDTGSGPGVQSRAVDSHVVIREHEEPDCAVMEAVVRSWAPLPPIPLRWTYPVWMPDSALDPLRLKREPGRGGRPKKERTEKPEPEVWDVARFVGQFVGETAKPLSLIEAEAREKKIPTRQIADLIALAVSRGALHRHSYPPHKTAYYATAAQAVTDVSAPCAHVTHTHTPPHTPQGARRRKARRDP
jgi:hypothetical protein